jgi:hypothetical protein
MFCFCMNYFAALVGRYLQCYPSEVPGAVAAFAVDGTPADAVMLALNSPVFEVGQNEGTRTQEEMLGSSHEHSSSSSSSSSSIVSHALNSLVL